jgi:hypothetical protein
VPLDDTTALNDDEAERDATVEPLLVDDGKTETVSSLVVRGEEETVADTIAELEISDDVEVLDVADATALELDREEGDDVVEAMTDWEGLEAPEVLVRIDAVAEFEPVGEGDRLIVDSALVFVDS